MFVPGRHVLGVGALAAEPPPFDLRDAHVHPVNVHVAAAGVELVLRREFAQRRGGGPDVFVGVVFEVAARRFFVRRLFAAPVDDGLQRHPLLGEGVVGQQPFVGQEVEGGPAVQLPEHRLQAAALPPQFPDLLVARFVPRAAVELLDPPPRQGDLRPHRLALGHDLLQTVRNPKLERTAVLRVPQQEPAEVVARRGLQIGCERDAERFQDPVGAPLHEVEEGVGKLVQLSLLDGVQDVPDPPRNGHFSHAARRPAVEGERRELPFQHRGGVQEHPRRLGPARQHVERLRVEVEVVRPGRGDRQCEGVAVPASSASNALDVVLRRGGRGTKRHRGEVADVNPEFQRRGRGEQVRVPGRRVGRREALLQFLALFAGEERRVLGGDHPPHPAPPVQLPEPGGCGGLEAVVGVGGGQVEAGQSQPQIRLVFRRHERPGGTPAKHRDARRHKRALRNERPGVGLPYGSATHEARVLERHHPFQQHRRSVRHRERKWRTRQHLLGPGAIPGAPLPPADERLEAVTGNAVGREDRPRRAPSELLERELPAQPPDGCSRREEALVPRAPDRPALPHAPQDAQQQRPHRLLRDPPQAAELLAEAEVRPRGAALEALPVHPDGGGAGALQRAADGGPVPQLGKRLPAQAVRDHLLKVGLRR